MVKALFPFTSKKIEKPKHNNGNHRRINTGMEYILCSAIHFDDGQEYVHQPKNITSGFVLCGFRHGNVFAQTGTKVFDRQNKMKILEETQGFLTSKNRFVGRKEASEIAWNSNQIKQYKDELFSEDIY